MGDWSWTGRRPGLPMVSCNREGPALWPSPRRTASLPPLVPTTRKEDPRARAPLSTRGGDSCARPHTHASVHTHAVG